MLLPALVSLLQLMNALPAWEVPTGIPPKDSPLLADACGSGMIILIPLADRGLGGWSHLGEPLPGFPLSPTDGVSFRPAAFLSCTWRAPLISYADNHGSMHLVDHAGREMPGWPVDLGSNPVTGVTALDLDGDGGMELALGTSDGRVHLYDESGMAVDGWPVSTGARMEWQPSQASLGGGSGSAMVCALSDATITLLSRSGATLAGWPVNTGFALATSPATTDLDSDGFTDIIFATRDRRLNALSLRGARLAGWPYYIDDRAVPGSCAIGAVASGASTLQIAFGTEDSLVFLLDSDGTLAGTWRWPVETRGRPTSALIVATRGGNAVLACTDLGAVYAWDAEGREIDDLCFDFPEAVLHAPAVGDIDGDGYSEMVLAGRSGLLASYPLGPLPPGPWPQKHADARNSGSYGLGILPSVTVTGPAGDQSGDVEISYAISGAGTTGISVSFSTDAGYSWARTTNIADRGGTVVWRSREDLGSADETDVLVRITPNCLSGPGIAGVSTIFHLDNNRPPVLHLGVPERIGGGRLLLRYAVEDEEADVIHLQAQYSIDGGVSWSVAHLSGSTLEIDPWLYGEPVVWDAAADVGRSDFDEVWLRVRAADMDPGPWSVLEGIASEALPSPVGQLLAPDTEASGRVGFGVRTAERLDPLEDFDYEYSLDDGASWRRATVSPPVPGEPGLYPVEVFWESAADAPGTESPRARFRMTPSGDGGVSVQSSSFHLDNNSPPSISITSPGGYSLFEGLVPVGVSISDAEGDGILCLLEYRPRGDTAWVRAGGLLVNGPFVAETYRATLEWNSTLDLPDASESEIEIRVAACDGDTSWSAARGPVALRNTSTPAVVQAAAYSSDSPAGSISIRYEVADERGRTMDLDVTFSIDGGATWRRATVTGDVAGRRGAGYSGRFTWAVSRDASGTQGTLLLRITPRTGGVTGAPRTIEIGSCG